MARYKRETLEAKGVRELRQLVVKLGIPGKTKLPKTSIIDAIMEGYGVGGGGGSSASTAKPGGVSGVEFSGHSVLTNPSAAFGQRSTTTLRVTCGASSGNFPVAGKAVSEVGEFLREVLNVDKLSTGLVNGKEVPGDYVLREGDNLEFLKPAGKKGC